MSESKFAIFGQRRKDDDRFFMAPMSFAGFARSSKEAQEQIVFCKYHHPNYSNLQVAEIREDLVEHIENVEHCEFPVLIKDGIAYIEFSNEDCEIEFD